jgi:flagellar hook-associated protein 1 FlgK
MSGILSIGKSALSAAQIGLTVTGHNIANANTAGYSRQVVVQSAAEAQNFGSSFIGQGAEVSGVSRIYNEVLVGQMVNSQTTSTATETYLTELSTINNMLSDASAGVTPALNDFFAGVQDLAANPSDIPTRQSMLSNAQSLVNRLQSTANRLNEMQEGVSKQITSSVGLVNMYAAKIASLNDTIEKTVNAGGGQPNDLLDQRDQLVLDLSKQIKTTVVPQGVGSYNIYIGNGVPLVVGATQMTLASTISPTNPSRIEVAYISNGNTSILSENSLVGGSIGGLLQFRSQSLDTTQNKIGQIAIALASDFNTQHKLGFDLNGALGGNLFNVPTPSVTASSKNTGLATLTSTISTASALTSSDYRVQFDGTNYKVTRLSDNQVLSNAAALPATVDGLGLSISGASLAGDEFIIRPTRDISGLSLAITDPRKLAMGAVANLPGDNKNGLLLAGLQNQSTMNSGTTSYSAAFSQLVNSVGNKTRELKVTAAAEAQVLEQNTAAVQAQSGVNLDEEATNLIRYQQAYQAAGKMMQIASQLFDELLKLG